MPTAVPSPKRSNRTFVDGIRLVSEFESSGLSQADFARQRGLSEKSVSYWVRRVRAMKAEAGAAVTARPEVATLVQVAEVTPAGQVVAMTRGEEPSPAPLPVLRVGVGIGIEVRVGGRSLVVGPGFDRQLLRELVETLEGMPSC
jgi:DNA-binding transcriptional regulator YiaG